MGVEGVIPEKKLVALLDSRHLKFLAEVDTRILAALEFGYSVEEVAEGLGLSEATVRRHITRVKRGIFDSSSCRRARPG